MNAIRVYSNKRTYIVDYGKRSIIMTLDDIYKNIPSIKRSHFKVERFINDLIKEFKLNEKK